MHSTRAAQIECRRRTFRLIEMVTMSVKLMGFKGTGICEQMALLFCRYIVVVVVVVLMSRYC